jgi:uncharacterized protein (DUF58 family)
MTRSATPKLRSYAGIIAICLFAGLGAGRVEIVALAAPFVMAVVVSLAGARVPNIEVHVRLDTERALEGDVVEAIVELHSAVSVDEAELGLVVPAAFTSLHKHRSEALQLRPGERVVSLWRLRAERWGAHEVGQVALRVPARGGLITFEHIVDARQKLHVYPASERVSRSVSPPHTKMFSGDYVARSAGDGIEFANVRPFVRGDSVRRVNWRVTSRTNELHVNLAHPERDTDVVLFLDTFSDIDLGGFTTLDLTVRGAAAIAQYHLQHNDRVGLVGFGGMLGWLKASTGRTHTYRIAEFILDVNTTFSYAWKDIQLLPPGTLPSSALVIAFSPLVDERSLGALADIAARGFPLVIVNTLSEDRVLPLPTNEGLLAHRVWRLKRDMSRDEFRRQGVPVVTWSGEEGVGSVLAQIPRRRVQIRAAGR